MVPGRTPRSPPTGPGPQLRPFPFHSREAVFLCALDSRPSRSLPIKHTFLLAPFGAARAYVSARFSPSRDPSDRASLVLCAGTRHPEERLHVHRSHAMASLTIGGPLSIPLAELCDSKLGQRLLRAGGVPIRIIILLGARVSAFGRICSTA